MKTEKGCKFFRINFSEYKIRMDFEWVSVKELL